MSNLMRYRLLVSIALATILGGGLAVVPVGAEASGFRPEPRWGGAGLSGRAGGFRPVERAVSGAQGRDESAFARSAPLLQHRPTPSGSVFREGRPAGSTQRALQGQFRPADGVGTGAYQGRYVREDSRFRPAQPRADRQPALTPSAAFGSAAPTAPDDMLMPLGGYRFTGDPAW